MINNARPGHQLQKIPVSLQRRLVFAPFLFCSLRLPLVCAHRLNGYVRTKAFSSAITVYSREKVNVVLNTLMSTE
jgi:hypothetical protein